MAPLTKMARSLALVFVLVFAPVATCPAVGKTSLTGVWRLVGKACSPAAGAIKINPLRIIFDEYACQFDTVTRVGPIVRWRGTCAPAEGQETTSEVVARLDGGTLSLSIDGDDNGRYVRCPASP